MTSIVYADGVDTPRSSPMAVCAAAGADVDLDSARITMGWTVEEPAWIDDLPALTSVRTFMAGYGLRAGISSGRVTALPFRLGAIPHHLESQPADIGVVTGIRRGDDLAFSATLGWGDVLARTAGRVVVEIDADAPDLGAPLVEGNIVATIDRPGPPRTGSVTSRPADDIDRRIGAFVASLLPDDPTLQFGPGGIGEGIVAALDRPVRLYSGLLSDAMADLADRGLLAAPAEGAYAWGGAPVQRLAEAGMLRFRSVSEIHDISRLAAIPRMVGCNTAVQVGLDGAVNVERAGDRLIAGIGGHADFCAGSTRSVGGLSIIALRSTTPGGRSTIVPTVDTVSTPRADVDVVVTEHGIADLRGCSDEARRTHIAAIAHPDHRADLSRSELSRSDLSRADLSRAELSRSELSRKGV